MRAGRVIPDVCDFVRVGLSVRAVKEKRLEITAPNLVHIFDHAAASFTVMVYVVIYCDG